MAGEAQATADILKVLFGEKKTAAPAPTYDASTGQIGALDNEFAPEDLGGDGGLAAILSQYFQPSEALDPVGEATTALPLPVDTPGVQAAPDAGSLEWFKNATNENLANTAPEEQGFLGGLGEGMGDFFGNMDENMQSPSKTLGMGLLGQIDPRLGYAGLLSMGLFGKNKIFGK